jgi:hypothetical protein
VVREAAVRLREDRVDLAAERPEELRTPVFSARSRISWMSGPWSEEVPSESLSPLYSIGLWLPVTMRPASAFA